MFRSFIYLDEDKLYTYKRQLDGSNPAQPKAVTQKKALAFNAALSGVGLNSSVETNVNGEFEKDVSFDYDRFELALAALDREDYFDCALNADYDLTTIPAMKLTRIYNSFEIPAEFDMVNLLDEFKPMLMGQIESTATGEQEALENILGKASADIPIIIDCSDITVASKLNAKHLREDYSALEDYADQDVYILCKVVGTVQKSEVEIFDPLKDFIRLPRAMRRQVGNDSNSIGLDKISIAGPVLKVEVIAIYK